MVLKSICFNFRSVGCILEIQKLHPNNEALFFPTDNNVYNDIKNCQQEY